MIVWLTSKDKHTLTKQGKSAGRKRLAYLGPIMYKVSSHP